MEENLRVQVQFIDLPFSLGSDNLLCSTLCMITHEKATTIMKERKKESSGISVTLLQKHHQKNAKSRTTFETTIYIHCCRHKWQLSRSLSEFVYTTRIKISYIAHVKLWQLFLFCSDQTTARPASRLA